MMAITTNSSIKVKAWTVEFLLARRLRSRPIIRFGLFITTFLANLCKTTFSLEILLVAQMSDKRYSRSPKSEKAREDYCLNNPRRPCTKRPALKSPPLLEETRLVLDEAPKAISPFGGLASFISSWARSGSPAKRNPIGRLPNHVQQRHPVG